MSSDIAIRVRDVSKHYLMFDRPEDRLKQMVVPRFERLIGRAPRRYYRDFAALNGVSLDIARGETVGIIGRNGSGKSTLLQIVCGTLQPSSGSVEVDGRVAALLELGAGFNPEFTGRENVRLNAAILGLTRAEVEARFDDIARFADIGEFIDQPVKTYSSGMYVRLAFAVAVNVDPEILVVDEALAVGDEAFRRKCFARIEDIKDRGGTILFVSHATQMIVQLCDRAVLLDRGEKILEGRPKAAVGQYERLMNANSEMAAEIRTQLMRRRDGESTVTEVPELEPVGISSNANTETERATEPCETDGKVEAKNDSVETVAGEVTAETADFHDPGLVSQSMQRLEERGARIERVFLQTLSGLDVNVLSLGKTYRLGIEVRFLAEARDIGFGMAVKTTRGLIVAGATNHALKTGKVGHVEPGQRLVALFDFRCSLLPGNYYFGASVFGQTGAADMLMNRVLDALAFRVAAEPDLLAAGFADLSPSLRVEEL